MDDPDPGAMLESASQPLTAGAFGFAWSNGASTPPSDWATNTGGGPITIANTATGIYRVIFEGLGGAGGNAQVVAHGTSSTRCKVDWWSQSGSDEIVQVLCHTPAGDPINSMFVVRYGRANGSGPAAYLWADQPSAASYTPKLAYNYNSTGVANTITRSGVGTYTVELPGLGGANGNVLVTAHGSGGAHCNVLMWGSAPGTRPIEVRCWSATGALADSRFSLAFDGAGVTGYRGVGAFAWANDPTSVFYTPITSYSYNSGYDCLAGSTSAGKLGPGRYFMRHESMSPIYSTAHVTARPFPQAPDYCKVESWISEGTGVEIKTRCFDASGAPKDLQYAESYYTAQLMPSC